MSMSAELLSRSKRRLRMHITMPPNSPTLIAAGPAPRAASPAPRWREAASATMSGEGRRACLEEDAVRCRQIECDGGLGPQAEEDARQRHRRHLGWHDCAGEM